MPSKGSHRKAEVKRIPQDEKMTISAMLKTGDGLAIQFIAQPKRGKKIGQGELKTTARIKAIVQGPNRHEIIEIAEKPLEHKKEE